MGCTEKDGNGDTFLFNGVHRKGKCHRFRYVREACLAVAREYVADPRGQARARQMALDLVLSGQAEEATVWLAWRPGDVEPRWVEIATR